MTRRSCALTLAAMVGRKLLAAGQQGSPQQELPPAPGGEATIRVDVDLVNVLFTVRKKHGGELASRLTQNDVLVFEDGKEQVVSQFSRETNLPLTLGMLVDISGSQTRLIETERTAASAFFASVMRREDEAFLMSFGKDTVLLQDFTNSVPRLQAALDKLSGDTNMRQGQGRAPQSGGQGGGQNPQQYPGQDPPMGRGRRGGGWPGAGIPGSTGPRSRPSQQGGRGGKGTLLYDGVYLAATDEFQPKTGRKAMLLITDGEDRGSYYHRDSAIEAAQRSDTIIYSIYYVDPRVYQQRGSGRMNGSGDLQRMSEETGGRMFTVDKKHTLQSAFTDIQNEMRSQYSLAYKPSDPASHNDYHQIEVRTKSADYQVQARKGYYSRHAKTS